MLKLVPGDRTQSPWDVHPQEDRGISTAGSRAAPAWVPALPCSPAGPDSLTGSWLLYATTLADLRTPALIAYLLHLHSSLTDQTVKVQCPRIHTSRRINLSGMHPPPQTRSKSKQPGEDTAEFSKPNRKKVDFLTEETSKGKVLAFPTLPSHSSFQVAWDLEGSQSEWRLLATGGHSGTLRPGGI